MLQRVLEPEVMDSPAESLAYDSMDHEAVNHLFVDDMLSAAGTELHGQVLDVGTGTARIPIELCRRGPGWTVLGIDLSSGMLQLAKSNIADAGLIARIAVDKVDAKRLPYEDDHFTAVISNSIVHHIPQPYGVLVEALRVIQPGGFLFWRDLLRPPDDAAVKRLVRQYAGDEEDHQRKLFDDSLRAAFSLQEVRDLVAELGCDPMDVRTTSDRHWTWAVRI